MLFQIIVLYVRQIYVYPCKQLMKKPQNDSLYKVGTKYEQFTDSTNVKKANKVPKVKNLYIELACRL